MPYSLKAGLLSLPGLLSLLCVLPATADAQPLEPVAPKGLHMNDIQVVGTHNSYKVAIPPAELAMIAAKSPVGARSLDYSHLPLAQQLDMGMRQIEIDFLYDPEGGRYAHPLLPQMSGQPYDAANMDKPGFKVLHIPDVDVRSHCATFVICLQQIRAWSDTHPDHVPILIMMNAKDGEPAVPGGVVPLSYDAAAFDALDAEIRSVFSPDRLITPDDVRGKARTLREGALAGGWPTIEAARGKVFFALDESPEKVTTYMRGHESLEGLPIFVNAVSEDTPNAAYLTLNDPVAEFKRIQADVKAGFMVRTRADDSTTEARNNDRTRFEKALASGAQYISTDYPVPRPEFSPYFIALPEDAPARKNPVRTP